LLIACAIGLLQSTVSIFSTGVINSSSTGGSLLHTSGTGLYDSNNNTAKLYLVTIHDGQGFHMKQTDIQNIKAWGFDGIRFFIYWGIAQPAANSISTAYFTNGTGEPGTNAIDNIVNWCRDAGLYVLLCPAWTSYWDMASWSQSSTGLSTAGGGSLSDMLNDANIQAGIQYLYGWMAQRYASYWNVCFENFNELESVSRPCSATERQAWANFNNMWVSAIEQNEGSINHIKVIQLLYDWSQWNYVLSTSTPATISGNHSNIILATHSYPFCKDSASVADQCGNVWSSFIHNQGYPWMDTEYSHCLGGGLTGLQQGTGIIVKYNAVGWGYFDFESSNNAQNGANVNNPSYRTGILNILQPYMLAS